MYKLYINGEFIEGEGEKVKILDPADNSVIEDLNSASAAQCEAALEAAKAAFPSWSRTPIGERVAWLNKLIDAIVEDREKIAEILMAETGKVYSTALDGAWGFEDFARYYAIEGSRIDGTTVYSANKAYGELYHMVERRSLGVVVAHIAWNYPVAMTALKIGPALVAGDPIVIKPSTDTPLATLYLGEICDRIGLPKGVINIVWGPASVVAKTLNSSTIPSMITIIGNSNTAKRAIAESATSIKRYSMELGGNAPVIIMPDADIDQAAANTVGKKLYNSGQDCTCYNRIYVHEDVYDAYLEKVQAAMAPVRCGSKKDEGMILGPVSTRKSRDRLLELVEDAVSKGATLVAGGKVPAGLEAGNFIELTLLKDCNEDMRVTREEIFGPIIAVNKFSDLDDVLEKANNTDLGLASYFYCHDARAIAKAFETLQTGDVFINGGNGGAHVPHIGAKQSGIGCDQSKWSMMEYFQLKRISMQP